MSKTKARYIKDASGGFRLFNAITDDPKKAVVFVKVKKKLKYKEDKPLVTLEFKKPNRKQDEPKRELKFKPKQ